MQNCANAIKNEIVLYAKLLDQKGLVNSLEGNISILDRKNNLLYITPSGTRKSFLNEDRIAVLKNGEQVGGSLKRSSEYLLHEAALKARPDCSAAVHTHAPYLTAYAYCRKAVKLRCSTSFSLLYEEIPCLPYGEPGTEHIADGIEALIKDHDLILLGNHGCISVGKDLETAVSLTEVCEEVLKAHHLAQCIGEVKDIEPDQLEALLERHPASRRNRYK